MATVIGETSVGVTLGIRPGSGSGTNDALQRVLSQALPRHKWTFGTGTYQINKWYENIASGLTVPVGSASIDLNALGGLGGETVNFSAVKLLWIYNPSTTAGDDLTVDGNFITSNYAGTGCQLFPDSCLFIPSPIQGLTVTNGASDTIQILNGNAAAIAVKIFIGGT